MADVLKKVNSASSVASGESNIENNDADSFYVFLYDEEDKDLRNKRKILL